MPVDRARKRDLHDPEMQHLLHRLYGTGPNRIDADSRYARRWFATHERALDIIVHWRQNVTATIIGW